MGPESSSTTLFWIFWLTQVLSVSYATLWPSRMTHLGAAESRPYKTEIHPPGVVVPVPVVYPTYGNPRGTGMDKGFPEGITWRTIADLNSPKLDPLAPKTEGTSADRVTIKLKKFEVSPVDLWSSKLPPGIVAPPVGFVYPDYSHLVKAEEEKDRGRVAESVKNGTSNISKKVEDEERSLGMQIINRSPDFGDRKTSIDSDGASVIEINDEDEDEGRRTLVMGSSKVRVQGMGEEENGNPVISGESLPSQSKKLYNFGERYIWVRRGLNDLNRSTTPRPDPEIISENESVIPASLGISEEEVKIKEESDSRREIVESDDRSKDVGVTIFENVMSSIDDAGQKVEDEEVRTELERLRDINNAFGARLRERNGKNNGALNSTAFYVKDSAKRLSFKKQTAVQSNSGNVTDSHSIPLDGFNLESEVVREKSPITGLSSERRTERPVKTVTIRRRPVTNGIKHEGGLSSSNDHVSLTSVRLIPRTPRVLLRNGNLQDRDSDDLIRDPPSMFANSEMFGQRILRMASDATNQGDNLPEGAYQDESEEKAVVSIVVDGRVLTPKEIKLLGLMTEDRSSVDAIFNSKASKLLSKIKDLTEKGSKSKEESVDGNYKEADRESMNESPLESVINVEI